MRNLALSGIFSCGRAILYFAVLDSGPRQAGKAPGVTSTTPCNIYLSIFYLLLSEEYILQSMILESPQSHPYRDFENEEHHHKSARIKLRGLSPSIFSHALNAAFRIFEKPEDQLAIEEDYRMSLEPERFEEERRAKGINTEKYWIATKSKKSHDVAGITGLETKVGDPDDVAWLGWFGVVPEYRGKGYGRALLKKTISKARLVGFDKLRLWTTTAPEEIAAQDMYEEFGFRLTGDEQVPSSGQFILFREKLL